MACWNSLFPCGDQFTCSTLFHHLQPSNGREYYPLETRMTASSHTCVYCILTCVMGYVGYVSHISDSCAVVSVHQEKRDRPYCSDAILYEHLQRTMCHFQLTSILPMRLMFVDFVVLLAVYDTYNLFPT
jgi:hypothetical protein